MIVIVDVLGGRCNIRLIFSVVPETVGEQEPEHLLALARVLELRVEVAESGVATR